MKIIGMNGSGRKDGNIAILIRKIFEVLQSQNKKNSEDYSSLFFRPVSRMCFVKNFIFCNSL